MFIHKVDGLSDDQRSEALKDINFKVNDELSEAGISINLKTQLTSVYDYSIFEALSIVGQKLIPEVSVHRSSSFKRSCCSKSAHELKFQ